MLAAIADRAREQIEEHYQVELANLTLETQAEVERHRSLAQMVAGVAHELNTPLGITNTAVDMLAKRLSRPEVVALFQGSDETARLLDDIQEATALAHRNIARAHQLIQDFKKISVDQLVDAPQREDLAELVDQHRRPLHDQRPPGRVDIDIDDRLPATNDGWFGYPGLLTQVLLNLLTNIDATPTSLELAAGSTSSSPLPMPPAPTFTITVRDHGQGIAPEHLDKVFEPFFTTGRSKGGTGLGLVHRPQHRHRRPPGRDHPRVRTGRGATFQSRSLRR